ncbi:MAG: NADPH-dependent F420 reductase [Nocardioides sp.]|nr:NADPH-dependent F420 reductase [Nocardioides sp.]
MSRQSIAIVGGTGPQGRGLAYRLATSGHEVILGSRDEERARSAADELAVRLPPTACISGATNLEAARKAEVVLLAVPYDGHDELVASLRDVVEGKIVISCVNPLGFDKQGPFGLDVPRGSAAESAAALLPGSTVVGAFHHLSAVTLITDEQLLEDVLVVGDDEAAKHVVIELARSVTGRPGIAAGRLRLARQLEPLTAVLISVNRAYKAHSGIRVTGLRPVV